MVKTLSSGQGMIEEKKKWMAYTYFNRDPQSRLDTTHLFSPVKRDIPFMKRVVFPTMTVDLRNPDFIERWSKSTRYKINKAEMECLTVDRGHFLLPDILKLFSTAASLKRLRGYQPDDFKSLTSIECTAIHYEGVMICSHVWVIDRDE